jgi:hypothetical protein
VPAPQPELKVGDSWTYTRIDKYTKQVVDTVVNTVQKIDSAEVTLESRPVDGQGGTVSWVYTPDGQLRKRGSREFTPGVPLYAFPLEIGKSWEGSYTGPAPDGTGLVDYHRKSKVVGIETVTVPAGTFTAVKIHSETSRLYKGAFRGSLSPGANAETIWYSPEAKRFVRMEVDQYGGRSPQGWVLELKELRLR